MGACSAYGSIDGAGSHHPVLLVEVRRPTPNGAIIDVVPVAIESFEQAADLKVGKPLRVIIEQPDE